jgi:hypothetical protein
MYWENICMFSNILQKISSQKSFLWKFENDHKKDCNPWVRHHWLIWFWLHPSWVCYCVSKNKQTNKQLIKYIWATKYVSFQWWHLGHYGGLISFNFQMENGKLEHNLLWQEICQWSIGKKGWKDGIFALELAISNMTCWIPRSLLGIAPISNMAKGFYFLSYLRRGHDWSRDNTRPCHLH